MIKRIYLDTNKWIELAQVSTGKIQDSSLSRLLIKLNKLIESKQILIPFSYYNLFEIVRQKNSKRKENLIDFMVDLSRGWFFTPIDYYFKYEIINACRMKLGNTSFYNIRNAILTNRADSIIGGYGKVVPREGYTPTKEYQDKMQKMWDDAVKNPKWMKFMFKDEFLTKVSNEELTRMERQAKLIEKDRKNTFLVSSNTFDKYLKAKWLIGLLVEDFAKILQKYKIPPTKFFTNKKEFKSLIEKMPALNVFAELSYARDRESKEREVKKNDYYDICQFATSVPYADIIVGEKMFGNLCKKQRLDKKYRCIILDSLKDLTDLEILSG